MKKYIILSAVIVFTFLLTAQPSEAGTYLNPYTFKDEYAAGSCVMVNNRTEADANHVYTLNPDHTVNLNTAYHDYLGQKCQM